ncbi:hypothetical protein Tsubulata_028367 [Turnera subulata]|uniref:PARP catalytic domain-containing protein n=1 Tax=Turnera subulata TaxID=218843 RepID=A0A9Q0FHA6_9ROSI|nr:hypothetical protein Tsubulata_028367 [Turnera subulata]
MAGGWVKSLQCKSRAVDDVFSPNPKTHLLPGSASCRKSTQSIKDVVIEATTTTKPTTRPRKPNKHHHHHRSSNPHQKPTKHEPVLTPQQPPSSRIHYPRPARNHPDPTLPALTELPEGHPSRNVVEIIFHTSWSTSKPFSGRVEVIFKVQNGSRTVARFEEYREAVKARAGRLSSAGGGEGETTWEENARCVADGNEMMRFHCLGPTAGDARGGAWVFPGGKGSASAAVCTFSGSGGAHESAGGGRGRRAMLVCRVIAGRVSKQNGFGYDSLVDGRGAGFDSVSGENGELLVFDPRAVLPCFLIIYKL